VGLKVGDTVGAFDGDEVGKGVGFPALYVGTSDGSNVGDLLGEPEGTCVGDPALYVGERVG